MKNKLIIACLLIMHCEFSYTQQYKYARTQDFHQTNNIRCYLNKVASELTNSSLNTIQSLKDWEVIRDQRQEEFLEMMGLQGKPFTDKRSSLNVVKTGLIQKEGYRIEKLYYESLPGLYVPANLYIPDGIKKPVPAILYVCGHSYTQKHNYQAHAKNFAQNGFVCLIIETIQYGEVRGEHAGSSRKNMKKFNWLSRGYTPGGVELWNGIRGLDLLSELPEVDKDKLGVTGISGGGSQSWFIAAADSRVKAAAAVAGAGTLESHVVQKTIDGHCDCMMPINTYGIDFSDIGALIAPRPFMIAEPSMDLLFSIESVHTLYNKVKTIYDLYGVPQNLIMADVDGSHSYGSKEELRSRILSFFIKELMGKDKTPQEIGEIDISKELSNEDLAVYVKGVPKDDITKTIQDSFIALATPPKINNPDQLSTYKKEVLTFLKEKTFGAFPKESVPLDIRLEFEALYSKRYKKEEYSFVSEEGWRLRIAIDSKVGSDNPLPFLLVLKNPHQERGASNSLISGIDGELNTGFFEARGIGDTGWSPSLQWHIRRAAAWTGRTVASMRVYDVLRCLEALRKIQGVDPNNISIIAQGEMAAIATYAALLDGNVKSLILKNPPATQNIASQPNGRGESIEMLNCLRITDLPQVAGLMFPNQLTMVGELPDTYEWTENLYKNLKKPDAYKISKELSERLHE